MTQRSREGSFEQREKILRDSLRYSSRFQTTRNFCYFFASLGIVRGSSSFKFGFSLPESSGGFELKRACFEQFRVSFSLFRNYKHRSIHLSMPKRSIKNYFELLYPMPSHFCTHLFLRTRVLWIIQRSFHVHHQLTFNSKLTWNYLLIKIIKLLFSMDKWLDLVKMNEWCSSNPWKYTRCQVT